MYTSFKTLLFRTYTDFFETYTGSFALGWGIALFFQSNPAPTTQNQILLALVANQNIFAVISIVIGIAYLFGLTKERPKITKYSNLALIFFWCFIFSFYLIFQSFTGAVIFGTAAFYSIISYLKK